MASEQLVRDVESEHGEKAMSKGSSKAREPQQQHLPLQSSPYVKYSDLEDYKRQGYGTQGHLKPKPGQGGGATDAPTVSGDFSRGLMSDMMTRK